MCSSSSPLVPVGREGAIRERRTSFGFLHRGASEAHLGSVHFVFVESSQGVHPGTGHAVC